MTHFYESMLNKWDTNNVYVIKTKINIYNLKNDDANFKNRRVFNQS